MRWQARLMYTVLFWVIYILFLGLSVYVVILLEGNKESFQDNMLELNCKDVKLTIIEASLDYAAKAGDRNGNFNCYCK